MSASRRTVGYPTQIAPRPSRVQGHGGATNGPPLPPAVVTAVGPTDAGTFSSGSASVLWGYAVLGAPSATLRAAASNSPNGFAGTFGSPTLSAYGGANAALTAPTPTLSAAGTGMGSARAALVMPAPTLAAGATATGKGQAALTFGSVLGTYKLVGYSGAVCSVTIGSATVTATGTGGSISSAALTLPLFKLVAAGTARRLSSADLLMPAARLGATAQAWLVAPGATLVALGSATVTATYEAYAVNLNHKPRPGMEPVDEVTRYTNFPFDRIVRYRNSYFGVAKDGLYLLQGTTDFASPTPTKIPWAFKTGITDFKSAQTKTVESAYFGGRMAAMAVQLHVGEAPAQTYTYPAPASSKAHNYRQNFGRGLKSRYYALGAYGTGVMELDDIDYSVGIHARRI